MMIKRVDENNTQIKLKIKESKYPEITYDMLNQETKDAMEEAHRIIHDPNVKLYTNFKDLWKDVFNDA